MQENNVDLSEKELSLDELEDVVGGRMHWGMRGLWAWSNGRTYHCPECRNDFPIGDYVNNGSKCPNCYPPDKSIAL